MISDLAQEKYKNLVDSYHIYEIYDSIVDGTIYFKALF